MEAKEFFNLVSSYFAHKEHARKEYEGCRTDAERKRCVIDHKMVLDDKWGQIECEIRRVHQVQAIQSLADNQQDIPTIQAMYSHITERIRINGCELDYLKREQRRLMELIKKMQHE